ncbi:MAG TPA: carboxypeptidase-like regulatory domain-containing protein [Candidatus Sulfotelmatobacter sp.]
MKSRQVGLLILVLAAITASLAAQDTTAPAPTAEPGHIIGTVLDTNGETLSGATIVLKGTAPSEPRKSMSDENGFFEFKQVDPGNYLVTVTAPDFADWTSPSFVLNPGQYMILTPSKLHLTEVTTSVNVTYTPEEIATEEVKIEETQRVFGIIPNFYVVYDPSPAPLTTKLKFQLALKTSADPFTIAGVGVLAAMNQAGGTPNYAGGIRGYSERFGAGAADGFTDIMIGGAILPSLLHQDPRYYYQGTGTTGSRMVHALSSPFVCKGDNGHRQINLSSMGGDLGSAALSNLYYPPSNRGANLIFENFALATSERMLSTVVQEFVLGKLTHRSKDQ